MTNSINKRHGDLEALYREAEANSRCGSFDIIYHLGSGDTDFVASINTSTAEVELDHLLAFSVEKLPVFLVLCRYARAYLKAEQEMNTALYGPKPGEFVERNT